MKEIANRLYQIGERYYNEWVRLCDLRNDQNELEACNVKYHEMIVAAVKKWLPHLDADAVGTDIYEQTTEGGGCLGDVERIISRSKDDPWQSDIMNAAEQAKRK